VSCPFLPTCSDVNAQFSDANKCTGMDIPVYGFSKVAFWHSLGTQFPRTL
jgi:hypothetical protein